ncbi:metallophosphoesterase [Thalassomonas actiniarum]|uniref:Metallophosphoesterase n=1 Tax=Thalassomonas actiniarum TaxID=485447 RepID=A0AAE9YQU9_9GAMM|nr:metallophosphoesterase [Thalassomonas actiniarum]WDD98609.1 metallophosphoesterase [Thalassomonas actiniarum]
MMFSFMPKLAAKLWLSGLALAFTVQADAGETLPLVDDGPYISIEGNKLNAQWFCQSKLRSRHVSLEQLPQQFYYCDRSTAAVVESLAVPGDAVSYQGDFKVAAISDFHGQYDLVIKLLTNNKIIDGNGDWAFGNGHFVITGDVFDRGDKVTELLWFLYHLENQAERAGGKVHLLLGNHEVMVLNGDLRYLHPKYVETAKLFDTPFEQLFAQDTVLGSWLRSKSVLVKVNDMLFAHGGFHPELAKEARSLEDINRVFKQNLVKSELAQPRQGWSKELHGGKGPIWYRGYFKGEDNGASSEEIDLLLKHFAIKHLVVGHTSQKQVETRYQGRVIAIDSSIKKGRYGEILLIDGKQKWRGTLAGEKVAL